MSYDDTIPAPMGASSELTEDFDTLGLKTVNKEHHAPKERLTTPSRLRDIHVRLREDDRINAYNRGLCQALLDGEPPYEQQQLEDANQPDTTNLNFQGAEEKLEEAKAPYERLLDDGENLVSVKTLFGPEDQRADWESVMNEEISATIRGCDAFPYESDRLIHKFVWEGVGIAHWADDVDWRFKASGLGQFFFPRQVAASESKQVIITYEDEYSIPELYSKVADREEGEENGWDFDVVCESIRKSASSSQPPYQSWERLLDEIKNNDLFVGTRLPQIRVIGGYVKEFDGTVSHYIIPEIDCGIDRFMFKERHVYKSMTEGVILFPYGSGTNTKLHGIRGLGYKLYPFEQQRNRSIGRLIDQGLIASSLMVQAEDETAYANIGLEYFGNLAAIPVGVTIPQVAMPDLQRSVMPAIDLMERLGNNRTAGYSPDNIFDGDQRKTKFEVSAHLEQSAELSNSALNFFYNPADRLFQQVVRRMSRRDYVPVEPGGPEIQDLRLRLQRRGVPLEAFFRIDWKRTKLVRVIGAGSAAAKTLGLQRMETLRPRMDDVGQQTLDRWLSIDALGVEATNVLFPRDGRFRTTDDTSIAILQNYELMRGNPVPVLSSEKHLAHAREHMKPMIEAYPLVAEGQITEAEFAQQFIELYPHTVEHVQAIQGDISAVEEAAAMRQMLQRIEEYISNGLKQMEAEAQENPQGGQPQEGPSVEAQERFAKAQAEIQIMHEKAAASREIKAEDAAFDRALKDANAAAEIRRKNAVAMSQPKPKAKSE